MTYRSRCVLLAFVLFALLAATPLGTLTARADPGKDGVVAREQAQLVGFARGLLGTPYVYGGTTPQSGFDCSGFTSFVYAHFGIVLPHSSGAQSVVGRHVARSALRPGDLVFFDDLGHVGIYVGNGLFIHAPHTGSSVSIDSLAGWYSATYDGARRIL
jgi:cell wall-associated NlpC family hydrolase